ncbi:MAG TPA: hypothetical protein VH092_02075 [Urbifossiella sp.]|jgi:hypothetical protein|nr:hypothetical protein [Urbifossiella sp.]
MPRSPVRRRPARLLIRWAAVLLTAAGCETALPRQTTPEPTETKGDGPARGAEPGPPPTRPPGKDRIRRGPYVFYFDFEVDEADPLFAELEALPDQVFGELGLPPYTGIIQVFLFDTQERYERYMRSRYRHLPTRRAYFIAEPRVGGGADDLKVFTWTGDHLRTDLRHELTHALLHGVLKDVPLWLDEGLAGYFELPPDQRGVNPQHLEMLRRGPFLPDLGRLERLDQVRQMEKPEYREAWAWVHLMLRGPAPAKQALADYLQQLRATDRPGLLQPRLKDAVGDPETALAEHLTRMATPRTRAAAPR